MDNLRDEIGRIKEFLHENPEGMSITDISGALRINRNSVAKYMDILQMQGAVDGRKVGTSKMYFPSRRSPVLSIRQFCSEPFLLVNQDQNIVEANPSFFEYSGIPSDQIISRSIDSVPFRFPKGGSLQQVFRQALRGTEQRLSVHLDRLKQSREDVVLFIPIVFENGKPGVALVIDSKKRGSRPHGPEEEPIDLLASLDFQLEFIVRYSADGIIRYVNEPYCRAVGRDRANMVGLPFKPIVSPDDAERIRLHLSRLTRQYPVGMIEYSAVMANGEVRWQRWQDRAIFGDSGELLEIYSCGIDITELVTLRQNLKKSYETLEEEIGRRTNELRATNRHLYDEISQRERVEEQLLRTQFALDHAADMVFWVGRNARIQYANEEARRALAYNAPELLALSLPDIALDLPLPQWDEVWDRLTAKGSIDMEVRFTRKDETGFPVEMMIKYLEYRGSGFACIFSRNISDRSRMEYALQEANRKINLLTSSTRHDIQNKITVILGFLVRARKLTTNPVLLKYFDRQEAAAHAIRDEILLTRDFKNLGVDPPAWMNLDDIVRESIKRHTSDAVRFEADLRGFEIFADRHLDRVFDHVFENVIGRGQGKASVILVSAETDGRDLRIMIREDWIGKPDEKKERFFPPRTRSDETRLFIAQEILSVTGIALQEDGRFGSGACFEICVPEVQFRARERAGPESGDALNAPDCHAGKT